MNLSKAKLRILIYMEVYGITIHRKNGSAQTGDCFAWPVSTHTFESLLKNGLIEYFPSSNTYSEYRLTKVGKNIATNEFPNFSFTQKG